MKRLFVFMLSSLFACYPCSAETPDESIDEYVLAAEDPGELTPEEKDPGDQVTLDDLQKVREEQQGAVRTLDEDFQQLKEVVQQQRKEIQELRAKVASNASNLRNQGIPTPSSDDALETDEETESLLKLLEESAPVEDNDLPQKKDANANAVRKTATKKATASTLKLPRGNAQAQDSEAFTLYEKGKACLAQNKNQEAKILFINAYKKSPKGAKAGDCLFELGNVLAIQGKKEDACIAWSKLTADFPDMSPKMKSKLAAAKKKYKCG